MPSNNDYLRALAQATLISGTVPNGSTDNDCLKLIAAWPGGEGISNRDLVKKWAENNTITTHPDDSEEDLYARLAQNAGVYVSGDSVNECLRKLVNGADAATFSLIAPGIDPTFGSGTIDVSASAGAYPSPTAIRMFVDYKLSSDTTWTSLDPLSASGGNWHVLITGLLPGNYDVRAILRLGSDASPYNTASGAVS